MLDMVKFGDRLRQARKKTGMDTNDAAYALSTSETLISRYECGHVNPGLVRVCEMAELYGCSIDWLCGLDGGKTNEG